MSERGEGTGRAVGVSLPAISVPKVGRSIRGLGETLATASATGTATLSIPLPLTPGRAEFPLTLQLSYDSGAGNGPFGLGWQLSTPAITRKTDKGLPTYSDADELMLKGSEELVAVQLPGGGLDARERGGFRVERFRPRIESSFTRIERWTERANGDVHWRAITRDNVLNVYGRTALARIAEPGRPDRVFSWLLEETRDDRGNIARYDYRAEDGARVDPARPCEASRFDAARAFVATAQRYLKRVRYGNRAPVLDREQAAPAGDAAWLFELVFDYGEHDALAPRPSDDGDPQRPAWPVRADPFSSYRTTFEVRTYRLCRRVLMFHRFVELAVDPAGAAAPVLVRGLELGYDEGPIASYLSSAREVGFVRGANGAYTRGEWPGLEFTYARPQIADDLRAIDRDSLDGIAAGVEPSGAQWLDLDGEGLPGVLIAGDRGWYYKQPLGTARLGPPALQASLPAPAELGDGQQLMDLGGDGNLDLVSYHPPLAGCFERTPERSWNSHSTFRRLPNVDWSNPQLRWLDLDGDGFADVLITEHDALVWYPCRAQAGFDPPIRIAKPSDERRGPAIVFSGDRETIHLADMTGDGLVDLVRVRNGEVCYWPNLGFGRFGGKVICERGPQLDAFDQFDPARVRFADIDGSGASDVIYLGRDGVRIYANQAGNGFADPVTLHSLPGVAQPSALSVVDLLGRGTSCLVVSSPIAHDPVVYIDLGGGVRPHALIGIANNLGAETLIEYAPSTAFYLADQRAGTPWATRLAFPVNVVARVETYDRISHNRFVTRYAYHHGYFDGVEREFCGFGMVEQWDSEELALLGGVLASNVDATSHVPPVHTKTWFHTGVHLGRDRVSRHLAHEYYREPGIANAATEARLLADSELPAGLVLDEEREACRALKGTMLRREVYALDGSPRAAHPYLVTEQSYAVACLQRRGGDRHGVFLAHPREVLSYHYERDPADPRTGHEMVLEVDSFGSTLKSATIAYGRRAADATLPLAVDRAAQTTTLVTYSEQRVTNAINDDVAYRAPLPCELRSFELTNYPATGPAGRYRAADLVAPDPADASRLIHMFDGELGYHAPAVGARRRRLIEHVRTLFRRDDLGGPLVLGTIQPLALPWDQLRLAFAPGMLAAAYQRGNPPVALVPNPSALLEPAGYRSSQALIAANAFPAGDPVDAWWVTTGQVAYSDDPNDAPTQELAAAGQHFFVPRRARDAFRNDQVVGYDAYDLAVVTARDAVGNLLTARIDYRVVQPDEIHDPNGNRTAIAFDARGMVAGTAVMGRANQQLGDSLAGFAADLDEAVVLAQLANPLGNPAAVLGSATTRTLYDPFAYVRTRAQPDPQPIVTYTMTRETHAADLAVNAAPPIQHTFSYRDGFGRDIQHKLQSEQGWAGSGWTIYNNKGQPVRRYEPFFTASHRFELARAVGVSSVVFYDPIGRTIATLSPDGTYQKVVFDAWREVRWDDNDTVLLDPRTDPDVAGFAGAYLATLPAGATTWYAERAGGARGPTEQQAAAGTALHAATPTAIHFDPLGQAFLELQHAGFGPADNSAILIANRVELDIEGNQLALRDAIVEAGDPRGRVVSRNVYDIAGRRIATTSLDAGARWTLDDAAGQPYLSWDSRGHRLRMERDPLRRPRRSFVIGADLANPALEQLVEGFVYGEQHPDGQRNLRGALYLHLDQAGVVSDEQHDFKGNSLRDTRRLARDYRAVIDWTAVDAAIPNGSNVALDLAVLAAALAPRLELDAFISRTRYDAMNRAIQIQPPHLESAAGSARHVVQPVYNVANLVARIDVWLDHAPPAAILDRTLDPPSAIGIEAIDYNAKGQRVAARYANGVELSYRHDPLSLRLVEITARRAGAPRDLQNVRYTFDPVGNVTEVRDAAQDTIYFANQRVDPSSAYSYDPLYRLISATGREHLGQGGAPFAHSADDAPRVALPHPGDGDALGRYTELFDYDDAGNLRTLRHIAGAAAWRREFAYLEPSRLEPGRRGNRLTRATVGAAVETYSAAQNGYDPHGNMLQLPHLAELRWSFRDQLRMTQRQAGANADRTWYVYDAAGVRVRKVTETAAGAIRNERIYLGSFERYRRAIGGALVRDTLHVMDGKRKLASIETRTQGAEPEVPTRVSRYRLDNHLGSVTIELDQQAQVVSYEEYSPYGSTTLRTGAAAVPAKRYGFSGKERDDETGFVYFGARYYAPWLTRWASCDPVFDPKRPSLYAYASGNPVTHIDVDGMYDPAAFGRKLEASVTEGEEALLLEDRNIGTSLVNTGISTGATVLRGLFSILQVGTGAAQGVEDIRKGFSHEGDAYDVAIGVSRILSDAGEVASASLGVAGNVTKVARIAKAAKVEKQIVGLRKRATALEKRIDDLGGGRAAKKSKNVNESMRGQVKEELDGVKERIGELAADKAAIRAGLKDAGNARRLATGGKTPGQPVSQGIDKLYTGKKPFAKDRAVFVEAKANLDAAGQVPLSTSGSAANPLTQGSGDWIRNRLATAAQSGNNVATNLQAGLSANRLRLESFAVVGDSALGGSSKVFRLTGQSGAPTVARTFGYSSEVMTLNLTLALDVVAHGEF